MDEAGADINGVVICLAALRLPRPYKYCPLFTLTYSLPLWASLPHHAIRNTQHSARDVFVTIACYTVSNQQGTKEYTFPFPPETATPTRQTGTQKGRRSLTKPACVPTSLQINTFSENRHATGGFLLFEISSVVSLHPNLYHPYTVNIAIKDSLNASTYYDW